MPRDGGRVAAKGLIPVVWHRLGREAAWARRVWVGCGTPPASSSSNDEVLAHALCPTCAPIPYFHPPTHPPAAPPALSPCPCPAPPSGHPRAVPQQVDGPQAGDSLVTHRLVDQPTSRNGPRRAGGLASAWLCAHARRARQLSSHACPPRRCACAAGRTGCSGLAVRLRHAAFAADAFAPPPFPKHTTSTPHPHARAPSIARA